MVFSSQQANVGKRRLWSASPASRGFLLTLVIALLVFSLTNLMLQQPWSGFVFQADDDVLSVVVSSDEAAPVKGVRFTDGSLHALPAWLLVEEPDFLDSREKYNALMAAQLPLLQEWRSNKARLVLDDGRELPIQLLPRKPSDIPFTFWLQLGFGLVAIGIGGSIWVFRPHQPATRLLLLTAIAFAAGTWSASIYSSRELLMEPSLFRLLSIINHGGALLFDGAMLALLWSYPRPLGKQSMVPVILLITLVLWLIDSLQLISYYSDGFYVWLLLIFLAAVACAIQQWRLSNQNPVSRMALRWLLFSYLLGSGAFVFLQILPLITGLGRPIPQSFSSGAFLIVYLGLAAGISRYRLFQLEHWWLAAWSWLFGGILLLMVDGILVWFLHAERWLTLSLSVGVAGWIYFPLRQWLVDRLLPNKSSGRRLQPSTIRYLLDLPTEQALRTHWPEVVSSVFQPLAMERSKGIKDFRIEDDGLLMSIPDIEPGHHVLLSYCERGSRLFNSEDLLIARELFGVATHARDALSARQQGARLERDRIKRDLHDDLGARLLSILHGQHESSMREEARLAIRDLRQMLATLDEREISLGESAKFMQDEALERLSRAGIKLHSDISTTTDVLLSARQFANIKRMVRECITNAIRHSGAENMHFSISLMNNTIFIIMTDDGAFDESSLDNSGRGHHIIHSRINELKGHVTWTTGTEGGCCVSMQIPLSEPKINQGQGNNS